MRKVIAYHLLSLDGVAEAPEEFITTWDEVMDANLAATIQTQDAVILGRRSFDEWAAYWPDSDVEPFATFINGVSKHIVTSTPLDVEWNRAHAIDGDLVTCVRELAAEPGGEIGVHASICVTQALLAARMIDELKVVIAPTIASRGRRLFDGVPPLWLETIRSVTSPTGHLLVDYRLARP